MSSSTPLDSCRGCKKQRMRLTRNKAVSSDGFHRPRICAGAVIGCGVIANQMAQTFCTGGSPTLRALPIGTYEKAADFARTYHVSNVLQLV